MIRLRLFIVTAFTTLGLSLPLAAQPKEDEVKIFFQSCMASLPTFSNVDKILSPLGFESSKEKLWIRRADGLGIRVSEENDRWTCMVLRIGDHATRFKNEIEKIFKEQFTGAWEPKQFQGRNLYLVRASNNNVLIEIIPPKGASTMLIANTRKE